MLSDGDDCFCCYLPYGTGPGLLRKFENRQPERITKLKIVGMLLELLVITTGVTAGLSYYKENQ